MPCFHQRCSQRGRDPNGIAVSTRTEGWLQHKHLPGGGFGFRCSPEFGKRRRQEALGHAEAWIGQDGSPGGGCRFLVLRKHEIADGYGLVTPKGKPVYRADPQRTFGPLDRPLRLSGPGQENAAKKEREGARGAQRKRPLECFTGSSAIMLHQPDDERAQGHRGCVIATMGDCCGDRKFA